MAKGRKNRERGKLADNSRERRTRRTRRKKKKRKKRSGKRKAADGEVRNVTRNVRQAAFSRLGHGPTPYPFSLPSFSHSLRPLLRSGDARAALASAISLTGYAPCAVRRVVQRPAFWFPARSKRVAGLSRRTNEAFRGCWPWYSLNCILVLLCMRGPARRQRRRPLYREIVFAAATAKIIVSSPTVIRERFAFATIISQSRRDYKSLRFLFLNL